MAARRRQYRSEVVLIAYDVRDHVVEEFVITYDEYYDASPPLIDQDDYRVAHGIRRVKGQIFNSAGELQAEFENIYSETGEYVRGKSIHQDGTVTED